MLTAARRILGIDSNVRKVLLFRVWTILAGIITVIAVPRYLSIEIQGYYYTFLSIVALQALFDLGLSQTVVQVSSHEFAHANFTSSSSSGGVDRHIAKLSYIKDVVTRWFRKVGGAFVFVVVLAGGIYFYLFGPETVGQWLGPWIALVIATGANLVLSPRLAIVEGAGWTGRVASLRLVQSVIGHALLVAGLASGCGLWSVAAVPFAASICSFAWLRWGTNPYAAIPAYLPSVHDHMPWRREILGLQWRVAIAWLGGYFASQVIVPVVFALQGAGEAGKLGLGLQMFAAVQVLGMAWISARVPFFGQLIARGDRAELKSRFASAALSSALVSTIVATSVVVVIEMVRRTDLFLVDRIPSTLVVITLAGVAVIGTIIHALAAYMRAHKEEPLVVSSLVIGGLTLIAALVGGQISTDAVALAYAGIVAFINLPWTVLIFRRYLNRDNAKASR